MSSVNAKQNIALFFFLWLFPVEGLIFTGIVTSALGPECFHSSFLNWAATQWSTKPQQISVCERENDAFCKSNRFASHSRNPSHQSHFCFNFSLRSAQSRCFIPFNYLSTRQSSEYLTLWVERVLEGLWEAGANLWFWVKMSQKRLRRSFNRFVDALTFTSFYHRWKKCKSSARLLCSAHFRGENGSYWHVLIQQ